MVIKLGDIEITAAILNTCHAEADKTEIACGSNMSFKAIEPYLEMLVESGLVSIKNKDGFKVYKATEKGIKISSSINSLLIIADKLRC